MSGISEAQFRELQNNVASAGESSGVVPRPPSGGSRKSKPVTFDGPVDVTLVLHGHCPSKKSNYRVAESGGLISTPETKAQMEALTLQAMFQWSQAVGLPVDHPEVTTTFYVRSGRSDEDGKYVTLMDVLQKAGIMVNDNHAHWNGRKVHEPSVFVADGEEKVEIRVVKKSDNSRSGIGSRDWRLHHTIGLDGPEQDQGAFPCVLSRAGLFARVSGVYAFAEGVAGDLRNPLPD